ncbi:MAG TPA: serine/threonine-protein kinase [Nostocaceae cyanobacterium]|nr:serine/threonine-protein kinase [Nostocaceae cyanobacterium]
MVGQSHNNLPQTILQQRYQIQKQLGKKAGRQTFLARDIHTQQLVIIKLLTFSNDFAWEDLKLFEREAETLKTLDHQAIPRYIDYFQLQPSEGKGYALVQSYVNGKSLEEHLQAGRIFTELEIKEIGRELLKILTYLHERQPPVIHRDIKPSNIILANRSGNSAGKVYLVDFGSVQTLATKAGKTITVVGTYGYMPPEQFGGYAQPASDLYSLGATLITLATGIQPADLPQNDLKIAFADIVELSPGLVDWLEWLIEPSLEKRATSAKEALSTLKSGKLKVNEPLQISSFRPVNTLSIFWHILWRTTAVGGAIVTICAVAYSTVVIPIAGTNVGGILGAMIGFPTGFILGLLLTIITRIFYYPLKNPHTYQRNIIIISMIVGTAIPIIGLKNMFSALSPYGKFIEVLFFVVAPAIITGLSMGVASKFIAKWYEERSRRIK